VYVNFTARALPQSCCVLRTAIDNGSLISIFVAKNATLYGDANIEFVSSNSSTCTACPAVTQCSAGSFIYKGATCLREVQCGAGYVFNPKGDIRSLCIDVDECAEGLGRCAADLVCQNTVGSYGCDAAPAASSAQGSVVGPVVGVLVGCLVLVLVVVLVLWVRRSRHINETYIPRILPAHVQLKNKLGDGTLGPLYHGVMQSV
jgi:hypothetical protein